MSCVPWTACLPGRLTAREPLSRAGDGVLWLGDKEGEPQMAVARGQSVTWLDDSRFAFVQSDDDMQVAMMTLPNREVRTLLDSESLTDALHGATAATRIIRVALASHPTMPDRLFVGARVGNGAGRDATHVFVYNLATNEITELLQVDHPLEPYRSMRFSADGRWLFVHSVGQRARGLAPLSLQHPHRRRPELFVRYSVGLSRV